MGDFQRRVDVINLQLFVRATLGAWTISREPFGSVMCTICTLIFPLPIWIFVRHLNIVAYLT